MSCIFCMSKNSHTDRRGLRSLPFLHFLHVQRVAGGADVERLSAGNRRMLKNPGIDRHMFLELCAPPGFCSRKLAVK